MFMKGATRVMYYYHPSSISKALIDLFPNIGLELNKMSHLGMIQLKQLLQ